MTPEVWAGFCLVFWRVIWPWWLIRAGKLFLIGLASAMVIAVYTQPRRAERIAAWLEDLGL
jgi:hypothetical protein